MKTLLVFSMLIGTLVHADYAGTVKANASPLKNVAVTDGLHVVKTDNEGQFTLPGHEKARFITITMPSGYMASKHYLPITDGKTKGYDFILKKGQIVPADGSHKFIHITDTEIHKSFDKTPWVDELKKIAKNEGASFIIHNGDICYEKGLKEHIKLLNTENSPCQVYYGIGNHDLVNGKYGEELFESLYGPCWYSFDVGNIHYIMTPMLRGDRTPSYKESDVNAWLRNDLAAMDKSKSVVVFSHDLLTSGENFTYGGGEPINLNEHNLKAWIYGHWHINYLRKQGDVLTLCTAPVNGGGIDHAKANSRIIAVDKDHGISVEMRFPYLKESMEVTTSNVNATGELTVSVNAYDTVSPVKAVDLQYSLDGKAEQKLTLKKRTNWNWSSALNLSSSTFAGKKLLLNVIATLEDGRVIKRQHTTTCVDLAKWKLRLGSDWNNLLGNAAHDGKIVGNVGAQIIPIWISNVGANIYMASPLISGGVVYTASIDEDLRGEAAVFALDATTGKIKWKHSTRGSVKNTIAADSDHVYAQDVDGWLYAINKIDGSLAWEKRLNPPTLPGQIEGLVTDGGIIYAGSGRAMTALDGKTGNELWVNTAWGRREGTTSTLSVGHGLIVGSAQWGALYGNDAKTGAGIWHANKDGLRNRGASASVHADKLYIVSGKRLFMLDTKTGAVERSQEYSYNLDATSTPLVTDKLIIFGTADAGLIAIDKGTWQEAWCVRTEPSLIYTVPYSCPPATTLETSPVLINKSTLAIGASDGVLYIVDINLGKCVKSIRLGAPIFSSVAVSGNLLIVTDFSGNVYAFSAPNR